MPDALPDLPALWVASTLAVTLMVGLALQFPSAVPARAATVAETVDTVAAAPYPSTARHPLDAGAVKLDTDRLAIRTPDGVSHATLDFGPVTPVPVDGRLSRVLHGAPVRSVFESPAALQRAATRARDRDARWRDASTVLTVRRVEWGGIDVTLVGV